MKKILSVLLLLAILAGCSNAYVNVSNPKESLIEVGDSEFSKEALFNLMKNQDPASLVIEMAKKQITEKKMPINDDITALAQKELDRIKEIFGDTFLDTLAVYGFESEADYLEKALIPQIQQEKLTQKYIKDNMEAMVEVYKPKKVRIAEFDDADKATEAISALQAGQSFEDVVKELSTSLTYDGDIQLVHSETNLPTSIKQFINAASVPTLSSKPIEEDSTKKAYVIQVVEVNTSSFEDELLQDLGRLNSANERMFVTYFQEGNFKVFDKQVYDGIKASYPDYLTNR